MAGTYTNLIYHLVFSTKRRVPWLSPAVRDRIHQYMGGHIRDEGGVLYEIGGMPDHVHLLARLRPVESISDYLRDIKSHVSGWIHETFPEMREFGWQDGYGAFSVSYSQMNRVKAYIQNQEKHHQRFDFKIEFIRFLKANGIEYDEQHIWG